MAKCAWKITDKVLPNLSPNTPFDEKGGLGRPSDHPRIVWTVAGAAEVTAEELVSPLFSAICHIDFPCPAAMTRPHLFLNLPKSAHHMQLGSGSP